MLIASTEPIGQLLIQGSCGSTKNYVQFCLDKNILEIVMLNADSPALDCSGNQLSTYSLKGGRRDILHLLSSLTDPEKRRIHDRIASDKFFLFTYYIHKRYRLVEKTPPPVSFKHFQPLATL